MKARYLRKFIFLPLLFIFIHLAAETPDELIAVYFQYLKNLEFEQAYNLLADEEKEGIDFTDYLNYMNSIMSAFNSEKAVSNAMYSLLMEKYLEYNILEIKKDSNIVKVELEIIMPNFYIIGFDLSDEMEELSSNSTQDSVITKRIKAIIQKFYPRGVPVDVKQTEYQIISMNDRNYLLTGIRSDIMAYKVKQIKGNAFSAREEGKLEEAITLYEKALAMNAQDLETRKALIECETQLEERNLILSRTIAPYISEHLVITEPVLTSTGWGKNLFCNIKNTGTKTVVYVKLRIIYYSDNNSIIDTYSFSPLDISAFSPLYPEDEKKISETIMFFPDSATWGEKKFTLEIIDYRE